MSESWARDKIVKKDEIDFEIDDDVDFDPDDLDLDED